MSKYKVPSRRASKVRQAMIRVELAAFNEKLLEIFGIMRALWDLQQAEEAANARRLPNFSRKPVKRTRRKAKHA